jgi:hypothetical protein
VLKVQRDIFLQMCQKVSVLKDGICRVKQNVPDEFKVVYNDIVYYPVAYELSFENGNAVHKAILHDLNTNCIIYTKLDRVDNFKK